MSDTASTRSVTASSPCFVIRNIPVGMTDETQLQLPIADKQLAACRQCHRILTRTQFQTQGCHGCGSDPMQERDELAHQTTTKFTGYVGIIDAQSSWVARLIGRSRAPPGIYAAQVHDDNAGDEDADAMSGADAAPEEDLGF
jgi:RNA polymerase subunit RPABC4/transcription elongation factor Spt4